MKLMRPSVYLKYIRLLPFAVLSCTDRPVEPLGPLLEPPQAITGAAISLSPTSILLTGKVTPNAFATQYHFEYGFTSGYGNQTTTSEIGPGTAEVSVQDTVSIFSDSTYHFRIVALYLESKKTLGSDKAFNLNQYPLVIIPDSTNNISNPIDRVTHFSVVGMVRPRGLATKCWFEYGLTRDYGYKSPDIDISPSLDSEYPGADIPNLGPGTYHWRFVAASEAGMAVTADSTYSFVPGSSTTDPPTDITSTGVTLNGHVITGGRTVSCSFVYGSSTFYGFSTLSQSVSSGSEPVSVSARVNDLRPGRQYHWRFITGFPSVTLTSGDSVLTTLSTPVNPKEFFFPELPGTELKYQYSYSNSYAPYGSKTEISGIHTWSIKSTTDDGTTRTIFVEDIRIDTIHNEGTYITDTTYVSQDTVQFSVIRSADQFVFGFPTRFLSSTYKSIPRYLEGTDSLTVNLTFEDGAEGYYQYISQIGLSGFSTRVGVTNSLFESMLLMEIQKP